MDLTLAERLRPAQSPVAGENARAELLADAYNLFDNSNLNPNQISNNIGSPHSGMIAGALATRVASLGGRFGF